MAALAPERPQWAAIRQSPPGIGASAREYSTPRRELFPWPGRCNIALERK
jgi:hypothetical protein